MALHGDLSSFPLPELLNWLDGSRKTGALALSVDGGARKVFLLAGQLVAVSGAGMWERYSRVLDVGGEAPGQKVMNALRSGQLTEPALARAVRQLAEEDLLGALADATPAQAGQFHWSEDPDRGEDEWVSVELSLRQVLFESLRRVDEAAEVDRALPRDSMVVHAHAGSQPSNVLHRVVVTLAARQNDLSLSRLWLQLGLSRSLVSRTVYDLLRARRVSVDGSAPLEADPVADMLEKGALLLKERQFDAAGLVFASLLQNDPTDRRVREFARMVDREHAAALYADTPPVARFDVKADADARALLRPEERTVLSQLESGWDVSSIVLASSFRELDTLKTIAKLRRMGVLTARPSSF